MCVIGCTLVCERFAASAQKRHSPEFSNNDNKIENNTKKNKKEKKNVSNIVRIPEAGYSGRRNEGSLC